MIIKMKMRTIHIVLVLILCLLHSACEDDPCRLVSCVNNGICVDGICDCPDGYSGPQCGIKDLCFDVNCINGNCEAGLCNCLDGYGGVDCSRTLAEIFASQYIANSDCLTGDYQVVIEESTSNNSIIIRNAGNFGANLEFIGIALSEFEWKMDSNVLDLGNGVQLSYEGNGFRNEADSSLIIQMTYWENGQSSVCIENYTIN